MIAIRLAFVTSTAYTPALPAFCASVEITMNAFVKPRPVMIGFVAAGYLSADALAERVIAARKLTSGPLGVNLFVPQPSAATADGIEKYTAALAPDAERYGATPGHPVSGTNESIVGSETETVSGADRSPSISPAVVA